MRHLCYDIETNGLFDIVNTIHSLVIIDADTDEMWSCISEAGREAMEPSKRDNYETIEFGLAMINKDSGNLSIAHNGVGYDNVVVKMLHPKWDYFETFDTMIVGKMIWPADKLIALDMPRWKKGTLPGRLIKRHSLEAWGYRLGEMKGEYAPDEGHDTKWLVWRQDMQDYCEQDVRVTVKFNAFL